tara:strand:+ start:70 stop:450 length:381 start_codon:yes stop_codon:yes gene_type:complete
MSIPIKLSHFTSTGTEANKRFQEQKQAPKPRDDWRVIFADKVTYPYNKVWDRDEQGHIKKDRKGAKMFNKVKDETKMLAPPRKIFSNEQEYNRWRNERKTFQEVEEIDVEEEEPEIEDLNSELIRD